MHNTPIITITNTRSGAKEQFIPHTPGNVTMYVCGVTPYDQAHIGHGRCYTSFDVLYRLLRFCGYQVSYCRNFTDIDDKLLKRAQEAFGDQHRYAEIATRYINSFHADVRVLNCLAPTYEPRVTSHIPEIIDVIKTLIDKGYAYVVDGSVYFHIAAFPAYGALSKQTRDELCAGARVEIIEGKKDPLDFALWKAEPAGEFWQSPWGYGRPGWHIECSVLARRYLGDYLDIHAGGLDLVFPHHENEIAQSEALLGHLFGTYWMHNGFVQINKEKMSKSLGNFFTLHDIFAKFDPMVIRYYYLTHYYRAPLEFAMDDIAAAEKAYRRIIRALNTAPVHNIQPENLAQYPIAQQMIESLCNDMNTPALLGIVFESLPELAEDTDQLGAIKYIMQELLGLTLQPLPEQVVTMTPEIEQLIRQRNTARAAQNWKLADTLRDQLKQLGIEVHDKKNI